MVQWLALAALAAAPVVLILVLWRRWYRLDTAPAASVLPAPTGIALFISIFLAGMCGSMVAQQLLGIEVGKDAPPLALADHARLLAGQVIGQAVAVGVYWWVTRRPAVGGRWSLPLAVLIGLATFVVIWPLMNGVSIVSGLVAERLGGGPVKMVAHQTLEEMLQGRPDVWFMAMAAMVVLAVPVLEEVLYRGVVQRVLVGLALGRWPAILVTSVLFAAMHWGEVAVHALPALFVLSIGLGWAYERTDRLAAPITVHAMFNALNLGIATLAAGPAGGGP